MDNNSSAPIAAPAKGGKGSAVGMVVCGILAIAGVGFGVYGMMNKPAAQDLKIQVKDTNGEITTIDASKIEKTDGGKTITITDGAAKASNIIIKNSETREYSRSLESWGRSIVYTERGSFDTATFSIDMKDGKITENGCRVLLQSSEDMYISDSYYCTISGLSGKISKAVLAASGHEPGESNTRIVFLMEDGTVQYVTTTELLDNREGVVAKDLNLEGFIADIVFAGAHDKDSMYGFATTLFVKSDGSVIDFVDILNQ